MKRADRDGEGTALYFAREPSAILIGDKFEVTVRWDPFAATCRLLIKDKPYAIWEISQKVLSSLFFAIGWSRIGTVPV